MHATVGVPACVPGVCISCVSQCAHTYPAIMRVSFLNEYLSSTCIEAPLRHGDAHRANGGPGMRSGSFPLWGFLPCGEFSLVGGIRCVTRVSNPRTGNENLPAGFMTWADFILTG